MSIFFRGHEILEMAERIERNGARFYRQCAECVADSETRTMLQELADMEDTHLRIFSSIKSALPPREYDRTPPPDAQQDELLYLQAWADEHVFDTKVDPCAQLTGKESVEDILKTAMGMEKDSIVFYLGFKDAVPGKSDRESIERILKEELKHLAQLSTRLKELQREMQ